MKELVCKEDDQSLFNTPTPETAIASPPASRRLCPRVCDCAHDIGHVNCHGKGLYRIPPDLEDSTVLLDLRQNRCKMNLISSSD